MGTRKNKKEPYEKPAMKEIHAESGGRDVPENLAATGCCAGCCGCCSGCGAASCGGA